MSTPQKSIVATYSSERNRFENERSTTLVIAARAEDDQSLAAFKQDERGLSFCAKGNIDPEDPLQIGKTYRFYGKWRKYTNKRTGQTTDQYCWREYAEHMPRSRQSLIDYIATSGKGKRIGPVAAGRLVDYFGKENVLEACQDFSNVLEVCHGVSEEQAIAFAEEITNQKETQETRMQLQDVFGKLGFPKTLAKKVVAKLGVNAPKLIKDDPYLLMDYRGVGFLLADKLWGSLGKDQHDIRRQTMAVWYVLRQDRSGSVWFPFKTVVDKFHEIISGEGADMRAAVIAGKEIAAEDPSARGSIATIRTDEDGLIVQNGEFLYLAEGALARKERDVATDLVDAMAESGSVTKMTEYTESQMSELRYLDHCCCNRCSRRLTAPMVHALDGEPYGPTCITKIEGGENAEVVPLNEWIDRNPVVRTWMERNPSAVIRVKEPSLWPEPSSLRGVSDHQRDAYADATTGRIGCLTGGPGTGKTTVIASIVNAVVSAGYVGHHQIAIAGPTGKASVRATQSLLEKGVRHTCRTWHSHLKPGVGRGEWNFEHGRSNPWNYRLIIGDEHSMPDIEIMAALMAARGIGTHMLFAGDIEQLAPVGPGAPFRDMMAAGIPTGRLTEIHRNGGAIVDSCKDIREERRWAHRYVGDWDSNLTVTDDRTNKAKIKRVIEQTQNAIGDGLCQYWDVQALVAMNDKTKISRKQINDAMQAEFNSSPAVPGTRFRIDDKVVCLANCTTLDDNTKQEVKVANGEVGRVVDIDEKKRMMLVELPQPDRLVYAYFGTDRKKGDKVELGTDAWDLGYAISCHKSQGSAWQKVFTVLDKGAANVCDQSWLTTAISRAIEKQVIIGTAKQAEMFCRKKHIDGRKTFLRERILLAELNNEIRGL